VGPDDWVMEILDRLEYFDSDRPIALFTCILPRFTLSSMPSSNLFFLEFIKFFAL